MPGFHRSTNRSDGCCDSGGSHPHQMQSLHIFLGAFPRSASIHIRNPERFHCGGQIWISEWRSDSPDSLKRNDIANLSPKELSRVSEVGLKIPRGYYTTRGMNSKFMYAAVIL